MSLVTRRFVLGCATAAAATAAAGFSSTGWAAQALGQAGTAADAAPDKELGQSAFRYRPDLDWGKLDAAKYPVNDCHGICEDSKGRIVLMTNDTHNNFIAYSKKGKFVAAWENRFPTAHGFEITQEKGEDRFWITDHDRQVVSKCRPDGTELRRLDPEVLSGKYPDLKRYHPTNTTITPDGDFYVSDGYGSSFVHHFDPDWRYISSFGGRGDAPENLLEPHAAWYDPRGSKPTLLVCDRGHQMLKWFSLEGELLRVVPVPGARPSNATPLGDNLVITSLNSMLLVVDRSDKVISVIGGTPPVYVGGQLQKIEANNKTFQHPHDVYADAAGDLYVAQWASKKTYPIKLHRLKSKA